MQLERYYTRFICERYMDRHRGPHSNHVTVIKSVGTSTLPNVHFADHLQHPLTLSNTFLARLGAVCCGVGLVCVAVVMTLTLRVSLCATGISRSLGRSLAAIAYLATFVDLTRACRCSV